MRTRVKWIIETLSLRSGTRLLECGCGTGTFTRQLARSGALITAVDISPDLLKTARRNCSHTNITFVEANLECPEGLAHHGFDAMRGISVLHHLDLRKALVGLKSLLKPGGRWAFSEPNILNPINKYVIFSPDQARRRRFGTSPSELAFHPEELRIAFEAAGYRVDRINHRDFLHPSVPELMIPAVKLGQFLFERIPLLRKWSGSLWINGNI